MSNWLVTISWVMQYHMESLEKFGVPEDSPAPAEGASSDEPKEAALSEEELRRAEEERLRAEEKAKRKAERKEKTKEWFRKHKILVIVLCVVFVVGVGMTVVVSPEQVDEAIKSLKASGEDAYVIGTLVPGEGVTM